MTVYSVRIFDGRLKMPLYRSGEWMAYVFDEDASGGDKVVPRTVVYSNFSVTPKGEMAISQWAPDAKDTN